MLNFSGIPARKDSRKRSKTAKESAKNTISVGTQSGSENQMLGREGQLGVAATDEPKERWRQEGLLHDAGLIHLLSSKV